MRYLLCGFAISVVIQISCGNRPKSLPSEKFKLTSHPRPYYSGPSSNVQYEHKSDGHYGPHQENRNEHQKEHKPHSPYGHKPEEYKGPIPEYHHDHEQEQDSGSIKKDDIESSAHSNHDLYTPYRSSSYSSSDSDSDSDYIPHSKRFAKYVNPTQNSKSGFKHDWEEKGHPYEGKYEKSEQIPRYGYHKEQHHGDEHAPKKHEPEIKYPLQRETKYGTFSNGEHDDGPQYHHRDPPHRNYETSDGFPLSGEKTIPEAYKSKLHHLLNKSNKGLERSRGGKSSYVPTEEFDLKHTHKHHHKSEDSKKHKPRKTHPFRRRYPHIKKFHHEEQFKSFKYFKPEFNFGGHHYDHMYKPKAHFYRDLKKDLDIKMRLLKEHEEKIAELQKGHLEKYRALFKPGDKQKDSDHESSLHGHPGAKLQDPPYKHIEGQNLGDLYLFPNLSTDFEKFSEESIRDLLKPSPHQYHSELHSEHKDDKMDDESKHYEPDTYHNPHDD